MRATLCLLALKASYRCLKETFPPEVTQTTQSFEKTPGQNVGVPDPDGSSLLLSLAIPLKPVLGYFNTSLPARLVTCWPRTHLLPPTACLHLLVLHIKCFKMY